MPFFSVWVASFRYHSRGGDARNPAFVVDSPGGPARRSGGDAEREVPDIPGFVDGFIDR